MPGKYVNIFEHFKRQELINKCKKLGIKIKGKMEIISLELALNYKKQLNLN